MNFTRDQTEKFCVEQQKKCFIRSQGISIAHISNCVDCDTYINGKVNQSR
jgi:hypothetical protein